eukprot:gene7960-9490_t
MKPKKWSSDLPLERPASGLDSLTALFNKLLHGLPVNLDRFVTIAKNESYRIFTEHIANRLIITLLNEQDLRISDKNTKLQIIEIFHAVATSTRALRVMTRIILQNTDVWFDDEVDEAVRERTSKDGHGELLPVRDPEILKRMKLLFAACWHTPPALLNSILQDQTMRIREVKRVIISNYACTAMQSIVRSKAGRNKLKRNLKVQAAEQEVETRDWSVLIIQKVARGYIARKTVLKSMKIRQNLSTEVLRIAEKYLKHGDLWEFLKNINDELKRSNDIIAENQAREDNWAESFVEKVIAKRQSEFNNSWELFPKALREFSGAKSDSTGALLTKQSQSKSSMAHTTGSSGGKSGTLGKTKTSALNTTSGNKSTQGLTTTNNQSVSRLNTTSTTTLASTHNKSKLNSGTNVNNDITVEEVRGAMSHDAQESHLSVPGVLMRKALATTVEVEVAEQLNKLINGQYRSRKLVKDIRDVYGPHSDAAPRPLHKGTTTLAPLKPHGTVKPTNKKKKRAGLNGQPLPQEMGRIDASHTDYLSNNVVSQSTHSNNITFNNTTNSVTTTLSKSGTINNTPATASAHGTAHAVEPGISLLIDIPQGLNDTIERLMHAAALRCYVPDFFQGVSVSDDLEDCEDNLDDLALEQSEEQHIALIQARKKAQTMNNLNSNADYAYQMYLQMPFGLAKMRYEVQCKKWAQGPINRMKIKGLSYLSDVSPVSKFVMCMKSVDTPRVLLNKCVDIYVELKHMGKSVVLGKVDSNSITKFNRSVNTAGTNNNNSAPSSPNARIANSQPGSPLMQGEIGFDSIVEVGDIESSVFQDNVHPQASISASLDADYVDTAEGRVEYRKKMQTQAELPNKVLLSMVENRDKSDWCDLKATVEDFFLHAAFLIVPHIHFTFSSEILRGKKINRKQRHESPMGNIAFKLHTAALLKMSPEEQRECVKDRFRAAFILTTPYTLYLKSKNVYTVDDLLRVNISDLGLPTPLVIQLEVLLTAVVAKCVDAKIVPIPRDHLSTAEEMFTVPMFYDPKFQRSPFDPFGRPPRLQPKGKDNKIVQKKLKQTEARENMRLQAHNNLSKVASVESIQEDLQVPVTLWTTAEHNTTSLSNEQDGSHNNTLAMNASTTSQYSMGVSLLDDSVLDGKWSFHAQNEATADYAGITEHDLQHHLVNSDHSATSKSNSRTHTPAHTNRSSLHKESAPIATVVKPTRDEQLQQLIAQASVIVPTDNNTWKKSLRTHESVHKNTNNYRVLGSAVGLSQSTDFMTRNIEDKVFKHSFVCTHPHCGQVFARQYTYNIHLKSHELFGQYHDHKRQPQLYLDKTPQQIANTAQKQYNERVSLPPVIQTEILSKSMSR